MTSAYQYVGKVVDVIDGDTLIVDIDLGLRTTRREHVRLYGVNAPEIKTQEGKAAKLFVLDWLAYHGPALCVRTFKDKQEKYGRWLVVLEAADGAVLTKDLVVAGHAEYKSY